MSREITLDKMIPGIRYVVTCESEELEFQVGDRIWLDGDKIMCPEAQGWFKADDLEATKNARCVVDQEWVAKKKAELEAIVKATEKAE